ncbi:hypothetical protein C5167_003725 [Papaver somniferum]|uniref:Dolichol phosphate-mannose biosynthesis regulatory protein n=1 Tax=Papaver somniferum TaxID=3469 RepID=A0A4Y7L540_PAPSO|nr:hypothetical protein C5167_003725 [Papaver somniferum]
MELADKTVGLLLTVISLSIFTYYTFWVIILPFVETDHFIHNYFLPQEYAILIPVFAEYGRGEDFECKKEPLSRRSTKTTSLKRAARAIKASPTKSSLSVPPGFEKLCSSNKWDFHEWLTSILQIKNSASQTLGWAELCAIVLWHVWKARCNLNFENKTPSADLVAKEIIQYINTTMAAKKKEKNNHMHVEFTEEEAENQIIEYRITWKAPMIFTLKLNIAFICNPMNNISGMGMLLFDHTGIRRGAKGARLQESSQETMRKQAATDAYNWAELGSKMEFESNSGQLIKLIRSLHAETIGDRFTLNNGGKNNGSSTPLSHSPAHHNPSEIDFSS